MQSNNLFYISEIEIFYKNHVPKSDRLKITNSFSACEILRTALGNTISYKESMYILLLNNANEVLGVSKLSEGGITGTLVDIRLLFQVALKSHSVGFILAHNHPSGALKPSEADKNLTRKVKRAGTTLDIKLLDHLIITEDSYYSFADENNL